MAASAAPLPPPRHVVIVVGGDIDASEAARLARSLTASMPGTKIQCVDDDAIETVRLQADDAVVCSPFDGATFAYLRRIPGLRIYGPAVCDHGLPTYRRQIYAATLSNPTGQPLSLYICLTEGVVREEIVDRLHWMGGVVEEDPEKADMYLANAHSELTKAARCAGKPVVRTLWVEICWQLFLYSKGTLVQGDRDYRLGALVGCKLAFCLVGVSDKSRKTLMECAKQCGAVVLPKVTEECTHFICTYAGRTQDFEQAKRVGALTVGLLWLLSSRSRDRWLDEEEFLVREDAQPVRADELSPENRILRSPLPAPPVAVAAVTPDSASGKKNKRRRTSNLSASVLSGSPAPRADAAASTSSPLARSHPPPEDMSAALRKRRNEYPGGREEDSEDDEDDDDDEAVLAGAPPPRQIMAPEALVTSDHVARASPTSSMRVQPAPELSRQVVPEEVLAAKCDMMRRLRAEDMLRCEKNLAASLGLILQRFVEPLRGTEILDQAILNQCFANIKKLRQLSEDVALDLSNELANWNAQNTVLARVFSEERLRTFSQLYSRVINNTDCARDTLAREIKTNKAFAAFVAREEAAPEMARQRLVDMMSLPMQHIVRYPLHLTEIIKKTPAHHPDAAELGEVLTRFGQLLALTDAAKGLTEKLEEVAQLRVNMKDLPPEVISGSSTFLKTKETVWELHEGKPHRRKLFLFTDKLLLASVRHRTGMGTLSKASSASRHLQELYQYHKHWSLKTSQIFEAADFDQHALVDQIDGKNPTTLKFKSQERMRAFLAETRAVVRGLRGSLPQAMQIDEDNVLMYERDEALYRTPMAASRHGTLFEEGADGSFLSPSHHPSFDRAGAEALDEDRGTENRRESVLHRLLRRTARRSSKSASKFMSKLLRSGSRSAAHLPLSRASDPAPVPPLLLDPTNIMEDDSASANSRQSAAAARNPPPLMSSSSAAALHSGAAAAAMTPRRSVSFRPSTVRASSES